MKVFISWAGPETKPFATFLHEWLQLVIQSVKPWMSEIDVAKGSRSMAELGKELEGTSFGIVVLTAKNQQSQWINFEAGAISKSVGEARVVPLLLDLTKSDLVGPLSQFQAVDATSKDEVGKLLEALNRCLTDPLPPQRLSYVLDREWQSFLDELSNFSAGDGADDYVSPRPDRDVLDEVLVAVRQLGHDVAQIRRRDTLAEQRRLLRTAALRERSTDESSSVELALQQTLERVQAMLADQGASPSPPQHDDEDSERK